jgi:asparagine synthetase B (glutamine-hydrolysing)
LNNANNSKNNVQSGFVTESDSEVLMHTLIQYGAEGLDELEGMWGFAYYNATDETLTLSRDRFGKKPSTITEMQQVGSTSPLNQSAFSSCLGASSHQSSTPLPLLGEWL